MQPAHMHTCVVLCMTQQLLLQAEESPTRWMWTDILLLEQVLVLYVVLELKTKTRWTLHQHQSVQF